MPGKVELHVIRSKFSAAMSEMYKKEVPLYGKLLDIVRDINREILYKNPHLEEKLGSLNRITEERHGAIRVGTASELRGVAKIFSAMGMYPVDYYDLSIAKLPVHSTAFRPVDRLELAKNPFRIFTSLLRVDLLADDVRSESEKLLNSRKIFTDRAIELAEKSERDGGLSDSQSDDFVKEALETFRWHKESRVTKEFYEKMLSINSLAADIVCFFGPHINHLTPRVLDIDMLHQRMKDMGIETIPVIQGPPLLGEDKELILLRQTSFKALVEEVIFSDGTGGKHRARFGEIEQRGVALTPEAKAEYDRLLSIVTERTSSLKGEEYERRYPAILEEVFEDFSAMSLDAMRRKEKAYFNYELTDKGKQKKHDMSLEELIKHGYISAIPITYEDFLPVSAAGIFKSNLDERSGSLGAASPNQKSFEEALGREVISSDSLYKNEQEESINRLY